VPQREVPEWDRVESLALPALVHMRSLMPRSESVSLRRLALRSVRPCMVVYGRSASAIPGAELHLFSEEGHLSLVYGREREILDRLAQQLAVTTDPKPPGRA
jgi:hypothetical protein